MGRGTLLGGHTILYGGQFGPEGKTRSVEKRYKPFSKEKLESSDDQTGARAPKVVLKPNEERNPAWGKSGKSSLTRSSATENGKYIDELSRALANALAEPLCFSSKALVRLDGFNGLVITWYNRLGLNLKYVNSLLSREVHAWISARVGNAWKVPTTEVAILMENPRIYRRIDEIVLARRHNRLITSRVQPKRLPVSPRLAEAVELLFMMATGLPSERVRELEEMTLALAGAERLPITVQDWIVKNGEHMMFAIVSGAVEKGTKFAEFDPYERFRFVLDLPTVRRRISDRARVFQEKLASSQGHSSADVIGSVLCENRAQMKAELASLELEFRALHARLLRGGESQEDTDALLERFTSTSKRLSQIRRALSERR
jgi:hypothetical protein